MKLKDLVNLFEGGSHFVVEHHRKMHHFYDPEELTGNPDYAEMLETEIRSIWHSPHLYETIVIRLW